MPSRSGTRGKSGGGKRPPPSRDETISKAMSYVLRHGAEKEGLKLNEGGYVNCGDLIDLPVQLAWPRLRSLKVTFAELQNIVATNSKQRFALIPSSESSISGAATAAAAGSTDASDYLIRATQGHSIKIDSANLLTPLAPGDENCPDEVVHGTFEDTWAKILKSGGLKKMGRQHVHFAIGLPTSSSSSKIPGKPDPKKKDNILKNKSASAEDEDDDDIAIDTLNITAGIPASIKTSNPANPEETVISGM
ncbi:MAG: hypothetical protein Q9228_003384, partial [Teloschistes exilis]